MCMSEPPHSALYPYSRILIRVPLTLLNAIYKLTNKIYEDDWLVRRQYMSCLMQLGRDKDANFIYIPSRHGGWVLGTSKKLPKEASDIVLAQEDSEEILGPPTRFHRSLRCTRRLIREGIKDSGNIA